MNGESTNSSAIGDDTIELELTRAQWLHLSHAAEAARAELQPEQLSEPAQFAPIADPDPVPPASASPQPLLADRPAGHLRRSRLTPIAKMSGYVIAYAAFAWWSVSHLSGEPKPAATTAVRPTVVIPRPAQVASTAQVAVKIVNPFDAKEVFEFPAGTSDAEGHEKMAQILLQRARERQSQRERIKPQIGIRTASLDRSP